MKPFIFLSFFLSGGYISFGQSTGSEKVQVNFNLRAGFQNTGTRLEFIFAPNTYFQELSNGFKPRYGAEIEISFPNRNRSWAILAEGSLQEHNSNISFIYPNLLYGNGDEEEGNIIITNRYVEIPVSVRHYLSADPKHRGFTTFSLVTHVPFNNSGVDIQYYNYNDMSPRFGLGLGVGYSFNNLIQMEFRLRTNMQLYNDTHWDVPHSDAFLTLGLNLSEVEKFVFGKKSTED